MKFFEIVGKTLLIAKLVKKIKKDYKEKDIIKFFETLEKLFYNKDFLPFVIFKCNNQDIFMSQNGLYYNIFGMKKTKFNTEEGIKNIKEILSTFEINNFTKVLRQII